MRLKQIIAQPSILLSFFRASDSLKGRAAIGAFWSIVELGTGYVLRLANNLIMTRLLVPEAFGLMAMVTTLQIGLTLLTDISIHRSIVQSKLGDTPLFLRVAWVVQILRGLSIGGLTIAAGAALWLLAPRFAPPGSIYADPALPGLIVLSSLALFTKGFESTNQLLAVRQLRFERVVALNLLTQVVGLLAMVALALVQATVWSLLLGALVGSVFRLVVSHLIFDGPTMKPAWDREIAAELWVFGRWLVLSSTISFAASYADRIILGGLLDARTFSYYTIASLWVEAIVALIALLIDRIGFSSLSETFRDRRERLAIVFDKFSRSVDLASAVLFMLTLFVLPAMIRLLYSEDYAHSAALIPLLSLGVLCARYNLGAILALSIGDSRTTMWASVFTAAFVFVALPIAYNLFGLSGALLAMALRGLAAAPLLVARKRGIIGHGAGVDLIWLIIIACLAAYLYATYDL